MSHRSTWLGAPRLNIMIHARLSWPGFTAPCSFAASNCGSDRPTEPSAPICRNSRRFKWLPPQVEAFSSARKSNMIHLSFRGISHRSVKSREITLLVAFCTTISVNPRGLSSPGFSESESLIWFIKTCESYYLPNKTPTCHRTWKLFQQQTIPRFFPAPLTPGSTPA
jgi:hypothetical protein